MRILVTGSSGRIGRRLADELLKQSHEVVGLDAKPTPLSHPNMTTLQVSLEDGAAIATAAKGVDAVIHLAALMSWVDSEAPKVFETNVRGTFHVLQAIAGQHIQRFLFASSGEVYPERTPIFLPMDEHHPTQPSSYYGMTKLLGEQMVWFYARKQGLPAVVLRFEHTQDATELLDSNSFFSGPRFFLKKRIHRERQLGNVAALAVLEPLDDGPERLLLSRGQDGTPYRMPICDTRDLVQGILLALDSHKAIGETIGIGPDEAISFDEAIPLMRDVTGLPFVEANLPGPAVNYAASIAKARELLGFRPRWDFRAMLQEAAKFWNETGVRELLSKESPMP